MPVDVTFQGEKHVYVYFQFQSPWTIKEFKNADRLAGAWVRNLDYTVDAIFDFADSPILPAYIISEGLDAVKHTLEQPNQGNTIVITRNPLVKHIVQVISHLAPSYGLCVAQDIHEAEQMLAHFAQDPSRSCAASVGKHSALAYS